jgi:hypothetical protein
LKNLNADVHLDTSFIPKDEQYDYSHNKNKIKMEQQLKNLQENIEKRKAEKKRKERKRMDAMDMSPPRLRKSNIIDTPNKEEPSFWESLWSKMPFVCTARNDHIYKYNS